MTTPTLDRKVEKSLNTKDVRYTRGRRIVVAMLAEAQGPRSAAELHARLGDEIPLSSLYRTLTVLQDAGIVMPHYGVHGVTRYELAEWLAGHHHHLICVSCGSVEDIGVPQRTEAKVQSVVDEISSIAGFTPANHAVEIEGRCSRCA